MTTALTTTNGQAITQGRSLTDIQQMASAVAKSGLFGGITTTDQAMTLMLLCESEGLHPVAALRRYHIIKGRPSMRADAMQASYQAAGGKVRWIERTAERVSAVFSHPASGDVEVTWTMEDATRAGLTSSNTWKAYPRQMLTARVISEGVRTSLPGVVAGIYTPEEVADFDSTPTVEVMEVRTVAPTVAADTTAEPADHAKMWRWLVAQCGEYNVQQLNRAVAKATNGSKAWALRTRDSDEARRSALAVLYSLAADMNLSPDELTEMVPTIDKMTPEEIVLRATHDPTED